MNTGSTSQEHEFSNPNPEGVIAVVEAYDAVDVIRIKRDRQKLPMDAIDGMVDAYTRGVGADEQMSALAMAIFLNGMDRE